MEQLFRDLNNALALLCFPNEVYFFVSDYSLRLMNLII